MKATYTEGSHEDLLQRCYELLATLDSALCHYAERARVLHQTIQRELSHVPDQAGPPRGGEPPTVG